MPPLIRTNQISLGIDISADRISLALLRQTKDGIKLVGAAGADVPAGVISNGNITDAAAVADAIKDFKLRDKIRGKPAVISLFAKPVLTQVMDLPKQVPGNISQYVHNEVRHCAILPNKNIALDYCGISSLAQAGCGRIFAVAAENDRLVQITRALNQAGFNIRAVEPPVCACARALYAKNIAKKFDSNVLMATVRDNVVGLCVFRNQSLDFIRSKQIGQVLDESGQGRGRLAEEINAILQFYEMEVPDSSGKWEFIVVLDESGPAAKEIGEFLKQRFPSVDVQVSTPESICRDTPIVADSEAPKTSLVAVGLAMKLMDTGQPKLKINLLPAETAERIAARKHALITANIAGAILIIVILAVGVLSHKLKNANEKILIMRQKQALEATQALLEHQQIISGQVDSLSAKLDEIKRVLPSGSTANWGEILDDIAQRTPRALCITSLFGEDNAKITIKGRSLSYQAVHLFVDMLGKSGFVDSADLIGTEKDQGPGELLSYSIVCSLVSGEGA